MIKIYTCFPNRADTFFAWTKLCEALNDGWKIIRADTFNDSIIYFISDDDSLTPIHTPTTDVGGKGE